MTLLTQNQLVGIKRIKKVKRDRPTNQPTDRPTDRPTDGRTKRSARD